MTEELPDILPEIAVRETGLTSLHSSGQEHCDVYRSGEGLLPMLTVETLNLSRIIPIASARFSCRCLYFVPVRPFMFVASYSAAVNVEKKAIYMEE